MRTNEVFSREEVLELVTAEIRNIGKKLEKLQKRLKRLTWAVFDIGDRVRIVEEGGELSKEVYEVVGWTPEGLVVLSGYPRDVEPENLHLIGDKS